MEIRPINNEADYRAALALADALFDAEPGTQDGDHLDVLITLIEAYEDRHWPIDAPDPIGAIRVRMAEKNLRARDLEEMIGSRGRVSEILTRKRPLTLPMIRRLSKGLGIPAEVLIQEIRQFPSPRFPGSPAALNRKSAPDLEQNDEQ
ncbi:MAG TPA: helix-turn-helix domain-containing protein [Longimicrobium sp.]|nr:helix-turn-helix domain-containing protein [Longimicrobium sp.]